MELLLERLLALGEGTHKGVAVLCHVHTFSFIRARTQRYTRHARNATHATTRNTTRHTPWHKQGKGSIRRRRLTLGETELLKLSDQHLVVDIVLGAVGDDEVQRGDEGLHIRIS